MINLKWFNESLNVMAFVLILVGAALAFKQPAIGGTLITGGFALLRGGETKPPNSTPV